MSHILRVIGVSALHPDLWTFDIGAVRRFQMKATTSLPAWPHVQAGACMLAGLPPGPKGECRKEPKDQSVVSGQKNITMMQ